MNVPAPHRPSSRRHATPEVAHPDLLLHYLQGAQRTVEAIDQLGNFLMGFGVLALGYLLQADLTPATHLLGRAPTGTQVVALGALACWATAVGLLLIFAGVYVLGLLTGRRVHARDHDPATIGEVLAPAEGLDYPTFLARQRTWRDFLRLTYPAKHLPDPEALLYDRWSALRFLAHTKLAAIAHMRALLITALGAGVGFKLLHTFLAALAA